MALKDTIQAAIAEIDERVIRLRDQNFAELRALSDKRVKLATLLTLTDTQLAAIEAAGAFEVNK